MKSFFSMVHVVLISLSINSMYYKIIYYFEYKKVLHASVEPIDLLITDAFCFSNISSQSKY